MELYKVCINHDPGLTMAFPMARSTYVAHAFESEKRKMSFHGSKLARDEQMDRKFMFMVIFLAHGVVCPCPRAIHMYMTIIFKHLLL